MSDHQSPSVGAVIVAAGSGTRFGDADKILTPLAGKPILLYSVETLANRPEVLRTVVVAGPHTLEHVIGLTSMFESSDIEVCLGGATRSESVRCGLRALGDSVDLILVHDAARPLISDALIERVINSAAIDGAAVPVDAVTDTLYKIDDTGRVVAVEDRERLRCAQTPQVARREWLWAALEQRGQETDEGSALRACGYQVTTVEGCRDNIKLTFPTDLRMAEAILRDRML